MLQSTIDLVVELEKSLPVGWELKRIGRPDIGDTVTISPSIFPDFTPPPSNPYQIH